MSFLDLVHFDGVTGRNRSQEALLNSQNQRNEFLRSVEEKRIARANERTNIAAANRIKRAWRRYKTRSIVYQQFRSDFDALHDNIDLKSFARQLSRIILFYSPRREDDRDRLVGLCSVAVSLARTNDDKSFIPAKSKLLFCKSVLSFLSTSSSNTVFGMPLRFMEVFLTGSDYLVLINYGYFKSLLDVLVVISPDVNKIEITPRLSPRLENVASHILVPFRDDKIENQRMFTRLVSDMSSYESNKLAVIISLVAPYVLRNLVSREDPKMDVEHFAASVGDAAVTKGAKDSSKLFCSYLLTELLKEPLGHGHRIVMETLALILPANICSARAEDNFTLSSSDEYQPMEVDSAEVDAVSYLKARVSSTLISQEFVKACLKALDECDYSSQFMEAMICFDKFIGSMSQNMKIMISQPVFIQNAHTFVVKMQPLCTEDKPKPSLNLNTSLDYMKAGWSLDGSDIMRFTSAVKLLARTFVCFIQHSSDDDWSQDGRLYKNVPLVINVSRELRDVCLSLVDLAFPKDFSMQNRANKKAESIEWSTTYNVIVSALQTIHQKDLLLHILPANFWSDHNREVAISRVSINPMRRGRHDVFVEPFAFVRYLHDIFSGEMESDEQNEGGLPEDLQDISPSELRNLSIVRSIPFILSFDYRLEVLRNIIRHDRTLHGQNSRNRFNARQNAITVRRGDLYEDAMQQLPSGMDLRGYLRVSMINWFDMPEIGQDGGGIYREFMSQLFKVAFDTERGLFILTSDRLLYPNSNVKTLYPDNYSDHYYFLGRMLGKLIYSRLMIDNRFADFFLIQLLRSDGHNIDIDVEHMKSYDPVMYKNLRSLLSMDLATLESMSLDFSVVSDVYGKSKLIELRPGGKNIRVTSDNRLDYVQSLANYYLRTRISTMVDAMRSGVCEVLEPAWLSMFSTSELQTIVSGVDAEIDVLDMKRYCGLLNQRDRVVDAYLDMFWDVLKHMNSEDKSAFLKFVTGCSRPPIQGFQALEPPMGLQLVPDATILPTSATCMNMLKLPIYPDRNTLETKLRYAINAEAGFELA